MARSYVKSKRAEREAETRERIAEAALMLHTELGPAQTTIRQVAERAGVQRHTVYAHFPDERALLMACSGLHTERDPLPAPELWEGIDEPAARLSTALTALYDWYGRNEQLAGAVLRDAEHHAVLREITELRMRPSLTAFADSVSAGLGSRGRAALDLAMSFYTWRTLSKDAGLEAAEAVALLVRTILVADAQ